MKLSTQLQIVRFRMTHVETRSLESNEPGTTPIRYLLSDTLVNHCQPLAPEPPETPENRQKPLFFVIYGRMGPWDPSQPVRVAISFNLPHRFVQMDEYGAGNDLGSFNLSVLSCLGKVLNMHLIYVTPGTCR